MVSVRDSDRSLSNVNAVNPTVAFNNIYGRKREMPFVYFVPPHKSYLLITVNYGFICVINVDLPLQYVTKIPINKINCFIIINARMN
jgi:hypothetical protein